VAKTLCRATAIHPVNEGQAEEYLSSRDATIARLIGLQAERWQIQAVENPLWGLIRIVIAQQITTKAARTITNRVALIYPGLGCGVFQRIAPKRLRDCGLPERKAQSCAIIVNAAPELMLRISGGESWEQVLKGIPGIGRWTVAVFRILVLHEPDVFPQGDLGLARAVAVQYGPDIDIGPLSEIWRPFRSVASWYLWRSLGNPPLD
jgi:DNA-3-methyladenine glycosylase II